MANFFHGVRASRVNNGIATPITAETGIPFVVGTAPVHIVGGSTNQVVFAQTFTEAEAALGYSPEWADYDLCEVMDIFFKKYQMSPVVMVNVLDPERHKAAVAPAEVPFANRQAKLPLAAIAKSVTVKASADGADYAKDKDYELIYDTDNGALVVEAVEGGAIPNDATTLYIGYDKVDPSKVTKDDIIGGFDSAAKTYSGLELINQVFPKYLILPDLILAPNWSKDSEVAAVMAAKAAGINTLFQAKALIDVDTAAAKHYSEVKAWKDSSGISDKNEIPCWPMANVGGKPSHFSVHVAAATARTDADNNGVPCESPSNKPLLADGLCLADGQEVAQDITQANNLNSIGVCTGLNFIGGYVVWGNYTACYPANTAPEDSFIPVSRMFDWVAKAMILTYWSKTDKGMTRRFVDSIVDAVNIWLNGMVASGYLLGGRIEYLADENSPESLAAGIMTFHIYLTPLSPAQEINFKLEYDISYVASALAA